MRLTWRSYNTPNASLSVLARSASSSSDSSARGRTSVIQNTNSSTAIRLQPDELVHVQHEDCRPADLHFDRVRHVELARLHHRRQRIDVLGARLAVVLDDREHLIDLLVLDPKQNRRVALFEKATSSVD